VAELVAPGWTWWGELGFDFLLAWPAPSRAMVFLLFSRLLAFLLMPLPAVDTAVEAAAAPLLSAAGADIWVCSCGGGSDFV